jgi:tRNA(Ile)-lysidine synthase
LPRSPRNIPKHKTPSLRAQKPKAAKPAASKFASGAIAERFAQALESLGALPASRAVAVSGGGDSVALMWLLAHHAKARKISLPDVVIVDHGLPVHTGKEPGQAARWARTAGLKPHILKWEGAKPGANIEALAREARYRLMADFAKRKKISALFVAHTQDDQAETFLLRLARGSGVDGLAAMRTRAPFPFGEGPEIVRPLLNFTRAELRAYLEDMGQAWLEDPMNEEARYARARLRAVWPHLREAGLSPSRIASAAAHLGRAREALDSAAEAFAAMHTRLEKDGTLLDAKALAGLPREIGLRAVASVLGVVSGRPYRPRFESLEPLYEALCGGNFSGATLSGCRIAKAPRARQLLGPATILISRETTRKPVKSGKTPRRRRE